KYEPSGTEDTVKKMVDLGRFGRKAGKGFYDYPAEGKGKSIWPGLKDMFPVRPELALGEGEAKNKAVEELKKRLLYVQAVDAARCLEEGVLTDPQDGDIGSIMGLGFAPQTGGMISLIDQVGVAKFVAECDAMAQKYGKQFSPPKLLRDMAAKGQSLYDKPKARAA
ncbi:MAG: 3-hydroxyacyl-CoA dehydrogenase, partial [Reyranellaceae bacterium]